MNKLKRLLASVGLAAALAVVVACGGVDSGTQTNGGTAVSAALPTTSQMESKAASAQSSSAQSGIWVTGEGTLTVEPDLVLLNLGVDSRGETVTEANDKATAAMDAMVGALRARNVEDKDIQTNRFSIYPQYDYREETVDGVRTSKEVLVGYRVRNSASAKIRNLDAVGEIIEEVVDAGGDSIRIEGINFTVEDPKPKRVELRRMAVADARTKAEHLAELSGVSLGELLFISEGAGAAPYSDPYGIAPRAAFAMAAADSAPSISGGEIELSLNVNAVFDIQ